MKSGKIKKCGVDLDLKQKKHAEYLFNTTESVNKTQKYEGECLLESYHGLGCYHWDQTGVYEGPFYSNTKDGYATLSLPNNSVFEGLFVKNIAFGPGILTHANGRQDVGFWTGRKLVRLGRPVDIVPRLAPTAAAKIKLLQFRRLIPVNEEFDVASESFMEFNYLNDDLFSPYSKFVFDPRSLFFNKILFDRIFFNTATPATEYEENVPAGWDSDLETDNPQSSNEVRMPRPCICPDDELTSDVEKEDTSGFCRDIDDLPIEDLGLLAHYWKYGSFKNVASEALGSMSKYSSTIKTSDNKKMMEVKPAPAKIVSWNRTELCTNMLKEIFRHRAFEGTVNLNVAKLMLGARRAFRRTGEKEKISLQFLKLCSMGPLHAVKEYLCSNEISEELMDARGNNSIMFAAANDQRDVIDALLDFGVDVNTFNDEGLTPLNLCLLRRLAVAHSVTNWEAAFLPANPNIIPDNSQSEEWLTTGSISSSEGNLGDESSIYDKDYFKVQRESQNQPSSVGKTQFSSQVTLSKKGKASLEKQKFYKRDDSMSSVEEYLFDYNYSLKPRQPAADKSGSEISKSDEDRKKPSAEREKKLIEIDKTIEKLLQRGADPNISEVPKPSLHLALFIKKLFLVKNLLLYGASPDTPLHANEGSLSPLHVLVLLKPLAIHADLCRLLLDFGANPDLETTPGFRVGKEDTILDPTKGRTPLQVLCMKHNLETMDSNQHLLRIGLMLAKVSGREKLYGGHTYITLSMISGNVKLLETILKARNCDPNCILGNHLGTALHVLVSTALQMKTPYATSTRMCDMLLEAGADGFIKFSTPAKLKGTCVDYGYREIETEKSKRRSTISDKRKSSELEKLGSTDYLNDHLKVVEYVKKRIEEVSRSSRRGFKYESKVSRKKRKIIIQPGKKSSSFERRRVEKKLSFIIPSDRYYDDNDDDDDDYDDDKSDGGGGSDSNLSNTKEETSDDEETDSKTKKAKKGEKGVNRDEKGKNKGEESISEGQDSKEKKKKEKKGEQSATDGQDSKGKKKKKKESEESITEGQDSKGKKKKKKEGEESTENEQGFKRKKKKKGDQDEEADDQDLREKKKKKKDLEKDDTKHEVGFKEKKKKKRVQEEESTENEKQLKEKKKKRVRDRESTATGKEHREKKKKRVRDRESTDEKGFKHKRKIRGKETETDKERKSKKIKVKESEKHKGRKSKKMQSKDSEKYKMSLRKKIQGTGVDGDEQKVETRREKERLESKRGERTRASGEDDSRREGERFGRSLSSKLSSKVMPARSETFPEKLRQGLFKMLGQCAHLDINQFLLPYVVLRDGNLYYRFKKRTNDRKEQYSLI